MWPFVKRHLWDRLLPAAAVAALLAAVVSMVAAETIDPNNDNSQFAYGENVGWINAEPSATGNPGVTVTGLKLTGYMYGENIGWINMSCTNNNTCATTGNYGVTNNGLGVLSGYAWGENVGWISFSCTNTNSCATKPYGVTIDRSTGDFSGYAYGENIGWISFSDTTPYAYKVKTADDGDGIAGATDNCPFDSNASQENTDSGPAPPAGDTGIIDNGPGVTGVDGTVPNGDKTGDVCDADRDNDGLPDTQDTEPLGASGICAGFNGSSDAHPSPALGDITNDDDGDANAAAPMGNDAGDNGPSSDTDNDGVLDGVECILGKNPRDRLSFPTQTQCANFAQPTPGVGPNTPTTDADADGLPAYVEYCKWGTSDASADTDGDTKGDCREALDVDGNGVANFPGDTIAIAKAASALIGKTQDFDFDDNGVVNFPGDAVNHAKRTQAVITCL